MLKSSLGIRKAVASAAAIAMTSFGGAVFAENVSGQPLQYNLAEPVTEIARQIYDLHTLMLV
ncbi:MAG: cytochrome c oxidase subunit II, partial [Gammaproteobacteria bacterium]